MSSEDVPLSESPLFREYLIHMGINPDRYFADERPYDPAITPLPTRPNDYVVFIACRQKQPVCISCRTLKELPKIIGDAFSNNTACGSPQWYANWELRMRLARGVKDHTVVPSLPLWKGTVEEIDCMWLCLHRDLMRGKKFNNRYPIVVHDRAALDTSQWATRLMDEAIAEYNKGTKDRFFDHTRSGLGSEEDRENVRQQARRIIEQQATSAKAQAEAIAKLNKISKDLGGPKFPG